MKNLKLYITVIFLACFAMSCEDGLDVNTDPLVATSADPNAVLPFVIVQYSNRHTTELGTRIMDVPQHFTSCFNSPRNGSTSIFLTGNTWGMYYTQVLGNLALVEQDAVTAGLPQNNINAIAKIFKALSFFELSSIWEEVPFSEALDGATFPSPKFDDQQSVFNGCVSILDQAVALIDAMPATGNFDVSTGDLIYEGDMDKWKRFANSLKLRIYMMMRKNGGVDSQIAAMINDPMIETNAQATLVRYFNTAAESNAYLRLVTAFLGSTNETTSTYQPSPTLYDLLNDAGDPRFDLLISDPGGAGPPVYGQGTLFGSDANIADNVIRQDLPHIMFTPAEIDFYKAELALDGVIGTSAQTHFNDGLTKILQFWGGDIPGAQMGLSATAISTFVGAQPAVTMQAVHEQLYLESFIRPVVAWNTVRRTGVPALSPPSTTTISTILKRFNYPPDEVSSNPNTPANLPTDTPMWFE